MGHKVSWPPPIYERNGKEFVRIKSGSDKPRDITLGPSGSEKARNEYARILAEIQANGGQLPPEINATATVAEVAAAYLGQLRHGERTRWRIRKAFGPVVQLYGDFPVDRFGPLALQACRVKLVEAGYCRRLVNQMTHCIRAGFKWAVSQQLAPPTVITALASVAALRKGETEAVDHPDREPVETALVESTLPHLPPIVADMVRVQLFTGARPGEVCALCPRDIDRDWMMVGDVRMWLFRLDEHKTEWRGGLRWLPIGPKGQAVLEPYLDRDRDTPCFSPAEVWAWWCQTNRKKDGRTGKRKPGRRYSTQAYGRCIKQVCERKNLQRWTPNQIRHRVGTDVEVLYGREDARCVLGHTTPSTTAIYAQSVERAARVIAEIG